MSIRAEPASGSRECFTWILATPALVAGYVLLRPLTAAWHEAPDLGHGWAAPVLMGFLWYERWAERPVWRARAPVGIVDGVIAVGAVTADAGLQLFLVPYPLWSLALSAHVIVIVGLVLYAAAKLGGRAGVGWVAAPLGLLPAVVPWPAAIQSGIIMPLRTVIAQFAAEVCNLMGAPALAVGTSVRLANDWVGIDEACGGIRSLQAGVMLALFLGEWSRFRWGRRVALVGVSLGAAVVGNAGRVFFLAYAATQGPGNVERVHDTAGWVSMMISLALTVVTALLWRRGRSAPAVVNPARVAPLSRGLRGTRVIWLAGTAGGALLTVYLVDRWYDSASRTHAGESWQWTVAMPANLGTYRAEPLGDLAKETLQPDAYLAGAWTAGDRRYSAYYVEWRRGQRARFVPFAHNPTVCLPYGGAVLTDSLGVTELEWEGYALPFHAYRFVRAGEDMTVVFMIWDPWKGEPLARSENATWWQALRQRWIDVRNAQRDQPAQLLTFTVFDHEPIERVLAGARRLLATPAP